MENYNIKEKQNYLNQEIIEKGYNPEEFINYISLIKGENGIKIENWNFNELKDAVENFKNQWNNINYYPIQSESIGNVSIENVLNNEAAPVRNEGQFNDFNKKYIDCIRQEKNSFSDLNDLKIIITTPEYIKKNIFSGSYYQYTIIVTQFNVECKRTFSDFEYLNQKLISLYPLTFFPPFPTNSFFEQNTTENMNKKVRQLNLYINSLSKNILIRSDTLFQDFLLLPLEQFHKKKKEYDLMKLPKSIESYRSMEGQLEISINDKKDDYCCSINSNIKKKKNIYDELDKAINDLIYEFNVISDKMNNVSIAFDKLSNSYYLTIENDNFYKYYLKLSKIFSNFQKFYLNQEIFYQEEFREDFKYLNKELSNFNQLNEEFLKSKNNYLEKQKQIDSKEVIIGEKLEKEFHNKKIHFGFILNRYYEEFQRVNEIHSEKIQNLLNIFIERNNKMLNDVIII